MPDNNIKGWIKLVDKAMSNTDHKIHTFDKSFDVTKSSGRLTRKNSYMIDYSDFFRHEPIHFSTNAKSLFQL